MLFVVAACLALNEVVKVHSQIRDEPVACNSTSLEIVNSTFMSCVEQSVDRKGGAVCAVSSGVTIRSSQFVLCMALHGGAFWLSESTVMFDRVNFTENSAFQSGGAGVFKRCHLQVEAGVTKNNEAQYTGGILFEEATGTVNAHVMLSNRAHSSETGGMKISTKPVKLSSCLFIHNHVEGGCAGAIFIDQIGGTQLIERCRFISNEIVGDEVSEIQISITGGQHQCAVRVAMCRFDTPLELSIGIISSVGTPPVQLEKVQNMVDLQTNEPWLREAGVISETNWNLVLTHTGSDLFAGLMLLVVPAFVFYIAFVLNLSL